MHTAQGIWPAVGLLGHIVVLFLVFLRNLHTIFHSDYINLHFQQQCKSFPFSPHPLQHLMFGDFSWCSLWPTWGDSFLYLWFAISVKMSNIEYLFMSWPFVCLLWRNVYSGLLPTSWLYYLFFWNCVAWATCIFWKLILCQLFHLVLFYPILIVVFSPCL